MSPADPLPLGRAATAVDLAGSVVLAGYVLAALATLARGRGVSAARLAVADGVLLALGIKTAGTLLKAIEVRTWDQIAAFAAVLALRTLLKRLFAREQARLAPARPPGPAA